MKHVLCLWCRYDVTRIVKRLSEGQPIRVIVTCPVCHKPARYDAAALGSDAA